MKFIGKPIHLSGPCGFTPVLKIVSHLCGVVSHLYYICCFSPFSHLCCDTCMIPMWFYTWVWSLILPPYTLAYTCLAPKLTHLYFSVLLLLVMLSGISTYLISVISCTVAHIIMISGLTTCLISVILWYTVPQLWDIWTYHLSDTCIFDLLNTGAQFTISGLTSHVISWIFCSLALNFMISGLTTHLISVIFFINLCNFCSVQPSDFFNLLYTFTHLYICVDVTELFG